MANITKEELAEQIMIHKGSMYRLAYSILRNEADAEDAIGECIVRAFEHRDSLRNKESIKSWLMQILVNVSRSAVVKKHRTVLISEPEQFAGEVAFKGNELWQIIMGMKEEYRIVLILYYYEQFSIKEISKMLDLPEGTVLSRLYRGREKLKKIVG